MADSDDDPAARTRQLRLASEGDPDAWRAVYPWILDQLRGRARRQLTSSDAAAVADTTAIVHEAALGVLAYLRGRKGWEGVHRDEFVRLATVAICHDVRDRIRSENARRRRELEYAHARDPQARDEEAARLEAVREAVLDGLAALEDVNPIHSALLTLWMYPDESGTKNTTERIAEALVVSPRTVERVKPVALGWLKDWLGNYHPGVRK